MAKHIFEETSRVDMWRFKPENLIIEGINDPETLENKAADPDWNPFESHSNRFNLDRRLLTPLSHPELQDLKLSLQENGQKVPITVRPASWDKTKAIVTVGKSRTRCIWALIEEGHVFDFVLATHAKENDLEVYKRTVIENAMKFGLTVMEKARLVRQGVNLNQSHESIAKLFAGASEQAVKQWEMMLDASESVQEALDRGDVLMSHVLQAEWLKHSEVKQDELLKNYLEAKNSGQRMTAKVAKKMSGAEKPFAVRMKQERSRVARMTKKMPREEVVSLAEIYFEQLTPEEMTELFDKLTTPVGGEIDTDQAPLVQSKEIAIAA